MKFPELKTSETLEKHYVGKMSKNAISLMSGILKMDPKERFTALDALAHSYFDTVRDEEVEDLIKEHNEKLTKQIEIPVNKNEVSRSKDLSRRKTSTEKNTVKANKNPYSLPLGSSPPQVKNTKKKALSKLQKDKKSSNSIKNLLQGRSSSKEVSGKRNGAMNSYDNTAYSLPKNKRNNAASDSLRENQSMSNYIPSSFNGLYIQNLKNVPEATEYDYEIGGEFGNKALKPSNKLDNSMSLPSQIYGTDELKNSLSSSVSGYLAKGSRQNQLAEVNESHKKAPSLSPSNRSEDNKSNLKLYHTNMMNKAVNPKRINRRKNLFENLSNDLSNLDSINETIPIKHEQKYSYYEEEKSPRTLRGSKKQKKRSSLKTRENTERRGLNKFKQKQPKQSLKNKNEMSIIDFNYSQMNQENEYNYEIPDSKDTSHMNGDGYNNTSHMPF